MRLRALASVEKLRDLDIELFNALAVDARLKKAGMCVSDDLAERAKTVLGEDFTRAVVQCTDAYRFRPAACYRLRNNGNVIQFKR